MIKTNVNELAGQAYRKNIEEDALLHVLQEENNVLGEHIKHEVVDQQIHYI